MNTEPNHRWIKIILPQEIPPFTRAEEDYIADFPFRKKTFKKASKQSKECLRALVAIIRTNKTDRGGFVHIPMAYLGKLFKSKNMAENVMTCALQGIVVTDNHYNADAGISKGYKLAEGFRNANLHAYIRDNLANRVKMQPAVEIASEPRNIIENDIKPIDEEKAMPSARATVPEVDDIDERIFKLVTKRNNKHFHKRYSDIGIDPQSIRQCSCCDYPLPAFLFSIGKDGILQDKCTCCWEVDYESIKTHETIAAVMASINRPSRRQIHLDNVKADRESPATTGNLTPSAIAKPSRLSNRPRNLKDLQYVRRSGDPQKS